MKRAAPGPGVEWRDLLHLGRWEIAHEITLSLPWLAASWLAAGHAQYPLALGASFMFFLTGLRQVHNAHHYALGVSRRATEWVMFALSLLMLGSMHAVQVTHLRHHRHCLAPEDVEAASARLPGWRALLVGPLFPVRLHRAALALATPRQRRWIRAELAATLAVVAGVGLVDAVWLRYHVAAMALGQCLTAFFAVWTVHHGCDGEDGPIARTIRGRLKAFVTYNMFYHVEHHLFPAVPTRRLPVLARRLDAIRPDLATRTVF